MRSIGAAGDNAAMESVFEGRILDAAALHVHTECSGEVLSVPNVESWTCERRTETTRPGAEGQRGAD